MNLINKYHELEKKETNKKKEKEYYKNELINKTINSKVGFYYYFLFFISLAISFYSQSFYYSEELEIISYSFLFDFDFIRNSIITLLISVFLILKTPFIFSLFKIKKHNLNNINKYRRFGFFILISFIPYVGFCYSYIVLFCIIISITLFLTLLFTILMCETLLFVFDKKNHSTKNLISFKKNLFSEHSFLGFLCENSTRKKIIFKNQFSSCY